MPYHRPRKGVKIIFLETGFTLGRAAYPARGLLGERPPLHDLLAGLADGELPPT